jgi:Zn-dependent M28 family amino/carboxypeptidase
MRIAAGILLGVGAITAATTGIELLDADHYLADVKFLASPELKGRATGSPEIEKAAHYIVKHFKEDKLRSLDGDSYLQSFPVTTAARLSKANTLSCISGGKTTNLKLQQDFVPFNFSSKGKWEGSVVFAGYGITAPEYNYDDYAGLDAKGKFVLVLRHEPQEFDEKSVFAGKIYTEHAQFFSKASNAKAHGALGVILINDTAAHPGETDNLEPFGATEGPSDAGLPFVQIKANETEGWFQSAGKNLVEIEKGIDQDLKPRSFAFPAGTEVRESIEVERVTRTAHNVIGYLPGTTDEYIIVGAHYDHLGLGGQFSLAPKLTGTVHPGADDNASGTAGVIELARYFAGRPKMRRGILFMTFAGEELGLLGSGYFVHHPELPLDKAVAMINMDMIGRIREGRIFIGGTGTGSTLKNHLETAAASYPALKPDYSETGYGSSDHYSFTSAQVPVLFFFSGLHADYHKPGDTADKIDAPDAVKLLHLIADTAQQIIDDPARPEFHRVKEPDNPHGGVAPVSGSASGGYGPWFGSIPDFGESEKGVKFADVTEGSPAAEAGFKGGDILTEFDGKPVQNLYDFTYALRSHKPGDKVHVKVLRGGQTVEADVLLRQRK